MKRTREKARPNAYLLSLTLSPGYVLYLLSQLSVHVEIGEVRRVSGASVSLSQRAERLKRDTRRGRAEVAPRSRRGRAEIAPSNHAGRSRGDPSRSRDYISGVHRALFSNPASGVSSAALQSMSFCSTPSAVMCSPGPRTTFASGKSPGESRRQP